MLTIWLIAGALVLACLLAYRLGLFDRLMLRVALVLTVWLTIGVSAFADVVTANVSDAATSATATIPFVPLWIQIIPHLAAGTGTVVAALAGWIAMKITGKHLCDADNARLQQAATNAAGRVLAQLNGPISNFSIDTTHPLIAKEAQDLMINLGDTIEKLGLTPQRVAALILGKIGQLQAVASSTPAAVTPPTAGGL